MGGKTQWVGIIAAAVTIIFLLFLTPLLAPLPTAALGAIIIVASLGLIDIAAFRFLRQVRPAEFWLAVITAFGVLTVGVLAGILVAVVLSLIVLLYRIARPHDALLDDVDAAGGTVYAASPTRNGDDRAGPDRLPVRRRRSCLRTRRIFTERLAALVANAGAGLKCVILDVEPISDFDSTAAEALETLDADLERAGADLWIAREWVAAPTPDRPRA